MRCFISFYLPRFTLVLILTLQSGQFYPSAHADSKDKKPNLTEEGKEIGKGLRNFLRRAQSPFSVGTINGIMHPDTFTERYVKNESNATKLRQLATERYIIRQHYNKFISIELNPFENRFLTWKTRVEKYLGQSIEWMADYYLKEKTKSLKRRQQGPCRKY